jgi:hypothetical protein
VKLRNIVCVCCCLRMAGIRAVVRLGEGCKWSRVTAAFLLRVVAVVMRVMCRNNVDRLCLLCSMQRSNSCVLFARFSLFLSNSNFLTGIF